MARGRRALRRCSTGPRCGGAGRRSRWPTTSWPCTRRTPGSSRRTGPCRCCSAWPRSAGADLRGGVVVRELTAGDGFVEVVVDGVDRPLRAEPRSSPLDAWTNDVLAGLDVRLPLTVLQEQVTYYAVDDPAPFAIGRLPVWIWMDEPSFYGFPLFGRPGVKIAQDCGGAEVTATTAASSPIPPSSSGPTPSAGRSSADGCGPAVHTATCLYTLTPDRDFVLDRVRGHPTSSSRWAPRTGSSSRRGSGARSRRWPPAADGHRRPRTLRPRPVRARRAHRRDQLAGVIRPLVGTPVSLRP